MTLEEVTKLIAAVRKDAADPATVKLANAVEWLLTYATELEDQIDKTSAELADLKRHGL